MCGKASELLKENTKGRIIIRLDKNTPIGIFLTVSGVALLVLSIFFDFFSFAFGVSIALGVIGITLLAMFKNTLHSAREHASKLDDAVPTQKCSYCFSDIPLDGKYCSSCGSKYRKHQKNQ
ncbi:zinc ribbon domain-containing protein [Anaerosporobacter sp.]|uniref:zinc ribbon domain-containing protein n=1 Tax=Anaerosporobacter sp. TaxID=1872529 RepID=UPI00286FA6E8|nr:zinc ribbon domain-containing protein [Anaerosporobacter sp.]